MSSATFAPDPSQPHTAATSADPSQPLSGAGPDPSQPLSGAGAGVDPSQPGAQAVAVDPSQPGAPGVPAWAGYPPYPQREPDRVTRFIQRTWRNSPIWVAPTAMLVCMAGAVGYTLATHPTEAGAGAAPTCLLKYTTGFICPGCGGTRAAWYLLHGDLPAAARHHALFVFAVPFLLYMYVAWTGKRLFNWKLPELTLTPGIIGAVIAAWGIFSLLRNLPWSPFTAFYV